MKVNIGDMKVTWEPGAQKAICGLRTQEGRLPSFWMESRPEVSDGNGESSRVKVLEIRNEPSATRQQEVGQTAWLSKVPTGAWES